MGVKYHVSHSGCVVLHDGMLYVNSPGGPYATVQRPLRSTISVEYTFGGREFIKDGEETEDEDDQDRDEEDDAEDEENDDVELLL